MRTAIILTMVRRTVTIPDALDERVRNEQREGESFSAAVARLLANGLERQRVPSYVGSAAGTRDLSLRVEEVLGEVLDEIYEEESYRPESAR
jgi:hypothetical protein